MTSWASGDGDVKVFGSLSPKNLHVHVRQRCSGWWTKTFGSHNKAVTNKEKSFGSLNENLFSRNSNRWLTRRTKNEIKWPRRGRTFRYRTLRFEELPGRILGWVAESWHFRNENLWESGFSCFGGSSIQVSKTLLLHVRWLKNGMVLDPTKWRNLLFMGSTASTLIYLCFLCHFLCVAGSFNSILVRVI